MRRLLPLVLALVVLPVSAQGSDTPAEASDLQDHTTPADPDATVPAEAAVLDALRDGRALTPAEQAVRETVLQDGVHVVHFWAPWCDNSVAELRQGWYEVIEEEEDVSFTFVTVWNDGEAGQETLDRYAIPERVAVLTQPDHGPSDDKALRRRRFLGLPVTWIPTTWVFRENGELAYAFNYGELTMDQLRQALDGARSEWSHD
ncbi:MAG: thioredoxin [Rubricoccaceae bacterium]|nr:thioredoxin [Rubricoccaceae bacterium]